MSYPVEVREVAAGPLAVVKGRARQRILPQRIRELFDRVYRSGALPPKGDRGLNTVLYGRCDNFAEDEFDIEAGIGAPAGFVGDGELVRSETPAGTVVTAVHWGAYEGMVAAHAAIHWWVRENGRRLAGPSWEIYGHWSDDPAKLRTDIFYLLK